MIDTASYKSGLDRIKGGTATGTVLHNATREIVVAGGSATGTVVLGTATQFVTCQLTRDGSEQNLAAWVNYTKANAYTYLAPLILTQTGTTGLGSPNGSVEYAVSATVVFYFESGMIPAINFRTDAMVDKPSGACVMSGYYVDLS